MTVEARIFLVSCVARKKAEPCSAAELYMSDWFKKARNFVENDGAPWFILSAKYGLLKPDTVIEPYDETLNKMGVAQRKSWAAQVQTQMVDTLPDANEVVLFAGVRYRENLMSYLNGRYQAVSVPMDGLQIGRQLSWLKNAQQF
jgi:Family of unknown function (DUF6884)